MIKKPNFADMLDRHTFEEQLKYINNWYDTNIQPVLDSAVEVYSQMPDRYGSWHKDPLNIKPDHKALLINIEPIKQETCADVLRDMVEMMESGDEPGEGTTWYKNAKAALDREKK